jgi:hypothetical protein
MEASFALWQADGARDDLAAAWRELQFLRDHAPQEVRVSMMEAVPLHREIAAAAKDAGL